MMILLQWKKDRYDLIRLGAVLQQTEDGFSLHKIPVGAVI